MFGRLIWDSDSSGMMTLADGKTAEFALDFDDADEAGAEAARNILKFLLENEPLIRHKIAVSMRRLYNENWLYDDPITPVELAQRIYLTNADVWPEGGDLLYEADVDLFAGHCIQVSIDANGEIGKPELAG